MIQLTQADYDALVDAASRYRAFRHKACKQEEISEDEFDAEIDEYLEDES